MASPLQDCGAGLLGYRSELWLLGEGVGFSSTSLGLSGLIFPSSGVNRPPTPECESQLERPLLSFQWALATHPWWLWTTTLCPPQQPHHASLGLLLSCLGLLFWTLNL